MLVAIITQAYRLSISEYFHRPRIGASARLGSMPNAILKKSSMWRMIVEIWADSGRRVHCWSDQKRKNPSR